MERERERETEREGGGGERERAETYGGHRKGQVEEYLAILVNDLGSLGRERCLEWQRNHSLFARLENLGERVFKKGISGQRRSQKPEIEQEEEWENGLHPAFTGWCSRLVPASLPYKEQTFNLEINTEDQCRGFCFDQIVRGGQTPSCSVSP